MEFREMNPHISNVDLGTFAFQKIKRIWGLKDLRWDIINVSKANVGEAYVSNQWVMCFNDQKNITINIRHVTVQHQQKGGMIDHLNTKYKTTQLCPSTLILGRQKFCDTIPISKCHNLSARREQNALWRGTIIRRLLS